MTTSARKIAVRVVLSACDSRTSASIQRVRANTAPRVRNVPATCRYPARASSIPLRRALVTDPPSRIAAGTESPTNASHSTLAIANQGNVSAAGTNTNVPTTRAASQARKGTRSDDVRRAAYAKASVKSGAVMRKIAVTTARDLPIVT